MGWMIDWLGHRDAVRPFELYSRPVLLKLGILGLISFMRSIQSRPDESVQKLNKIVLIRSPRMSKNPSRPTLEDFGRSNCQYQY